MVSFYRTLLDSLSIVPEVFRVNFDGKTYKTAGDPFTEKTATEEMKENYGELFNIKQDPNTLDSVQVEIGDQ